MVGERPDLIINGVDFNLELDVCKEILYYNIAMNALIHKKVRENWDYVLDHILDDVQFDIRINLGDVVTDLRIYPNFLSA